MVDESRCQQLDAEILDAVAELLGRIVAAAEHVAQRLAVPPFFIKALHTLECPMPMKDLGQRMHCDPSFITVIADMLEQRGLAKRAAHPGDRRVRNLVLTEDGITLRTQVERELAASTPWSQALTEAEREQLILLIRKMLAADPGQAPASTERGRSRAGPAVPAAQAAGPARSRGAG